MDEIYTEWAEGYRFIIIEEIDAVGHYKTELTQRMKTFISNDTIDITEKYKKSRNALNVTTYMYITNNRNIRLSVGSDRRHYIIFCKHITKKRTDELVKDGYFDALHGLHRDHAHAMYLYFTKYKLNSAFDPDKPAPQTIAKSILLQHSKKDYHDDLVELIDDQTNYFINPNYVVYSELIRQLEQIDRTDSKRNGSSSLNHKHVRNLLSDMRYVKLPNRVALNGKKETVYVIDQQMDNIEPLIKELKLL